MFSDPREGISQLESKFINIKELKEKLSEDLLNSIVLFYKYKKKKKGGPEKDNDLLKVTEPVNKPKSSRLWKQGIYY